MIECQSIINRVTIFWGIGSESTIVTIESFIYGYVYEYTQDIIKCVLSFSLLDDKVIGAG